MTILSKHPEGAWPGDREERKTKQDRNQVLVLRVTCKGSTRYRGFPGAVGSSEVSTTLPK